MGLALNSDSLTKFSPVPEEELYPAIMGSALKVVAGRDKRRGYGDYEGKSSLLQAFITTQHERISNAILDRARANDRYLDPFVAGYIKSGQTDRARALLESIEDHQLRHDDQDQLVEICFQYQCYDLVPLIYTPEPFTRFGDASHQRFFQVWSRLHEAGQPAVAEAIATACQLPYWRPLMDWRLQGADVTAFKEAWDETIEQHSAISDDHGRKYGSGLEALQEFILGALDFTALPVEVSQEVLAFSNRAIRNHEDTHLKARKEDWKQHIIATHTPEEVIALLTPLGFYATDLWPDILDYAYAQKDPEVYRTARLQYKADIKACSDERLTENKDLHPFYLNLHRERASIWLNTERLVLALKQKDAVTAESTVDHIYRSARSISEHDTSGIKFYYDSAHSLAQEAINGFHERLKKAGLWENYSRLKNARMSYGEEESLRRSRLHGIDWHLARDNPDGALKYLLRHRYFRGFDQFTARDALKVLQADPTTFGPIWEKIAGQEKYNWRGDGKEIRPLIDFLLGASAVGVKLDDAVWGELVRVSKHVCYREDRGDTTHNEWSMDRLFKGLCQQGQLSRAWQLFEALERNMSEAGGQSCLAIMLQAVQPRSQQPNVGEQTLPLEVNTPQAVTAWIQEMVLQAVLQENSAAATQQQFTHRMVAQGTPEGFRAWSRFSAEADLRDEALRKAEANTLWEGLDTAQSSERWRVLNKMIELKDESVVELIRTEIKQWPPRVQVYFLKTLAKKELIAERVNYFLVKGASQVCLPHVVAIFADYPEYLETALYLITVPSGSRVGLGFRSGNHADSVAQLNWHSLMLCLRTFAHIDNDRWHICQSYHKPESFAALKELEEAGIRLTPHLAAQYVGQTDRAAFLNYCHQTIDSFAEGGFDPEAFLHIDLEFTRFRRVVEDEKLRHHVKNHFTFADFCKIFTAEAPLGREELKTQQQQFEIECAAYEARLLKDFIDQVHAQAQALGRPLMVVPNLSYGYLPVSPMVEELEAEGIDILMGTKVGSSDAHNNPGVFNRHTLKRRRTRIMQQQPIILVVDGTQHLLPRAKENKSARYPDAHQGYLNHAIAINQALGFPTDFAHLGNAEARSQKLAKSQEFERAVKTYQKLAPKSGVQPYDFAFWNTADLPLVVRSRRNETQTIEPAQARDITGPTMIFCNVGVTHQQLPARLKKLCPKINDQHGDPVQHVPAFFDDSGLIIDLDFSYDQYGVRYTNQLERLVTAAYHRQAGQAVAEQHPAILKAARRVNTTVGLCNKAA